MYGYPEKRNGLRSVSDNNFIGISADYTYFFTDYIFGGDGLGYHFSSQGLGSMWSYRKKGLFELLQAEKLSGVTLTESLAMYLLSSVSERCFANPESKYFGLGKITMEQIEDLSTRKKIPLDEMMRWLSSVINE